MPPAQRPLFPDAAEPTEASRPAREDILTSELVTYCRMAQVPAVLPDTIEAGDAWGANCGPMSLAAVLGLSTVEATRDLVHPFRGFMSPTNMVDALELARIRGLAARWTHLRNAAHDPWPMLGLVRIQWLGPWCDLADPRAAYRYTHWVGVRMRGVELTADVAQRPVRAESGLTFEHAAPPIEVYDATPNRWVPLDRWARWCSTLWPKRATGWAPTNRIDVVLRTGPKGQVQS